MGTTFKYAPKGRTEEGDGFSAVDAEKAPVAMEDIFDDPSILDELAEANASLGTGRMLRRSAPVKLPTVDAFDFEEACRTNDFEEASRAKSLAHKFGPPSRDAKPKRGRWALLRSAKRFTVEDDDGWRASSYGTAPRNVRRAFFWGFCAALAIIIVTPAVFGFLRPADESVPTLAGDLTRDITNQEDTVAGDEDLKVSVISDQNASADPTTAVETTTATFDSNETVVLRTRPAAAAMIGPATTAFAAPLVRSTAAEEEGSGSVERGVGQSVSPAASPEDSTRPDEASKDPEPETIDRTATAVEPGTPEVVGAGNTVASGDPGDKGFAAMAQSQLSHNASQPRADVVEATPAEPVSKAVQSDVLALSAEEIDRYLARGEELLRVGDIASARLLFLRVAAAGDRRGARAVGMTYDPKVYARLPVMGLVPDPAQAELWYDKAGEASSYTIDLSPTEASQVQADSTEETEEAALKQWNAECARKYRSFDSATGLYVSNSGAKRRCQLP